MAKTTKLLCVLDGFGLNPRSDANAVAIAKKPNFDRLFRECPHTQLITFGERVGLPEGQMGNSEVGHLNIGAGRVVEQWLLRISRALAGPYLADSAAYQGFLKANRNAKRIHVVGLFSDGGVHSHRDHLLLLLARLRRDLEGELVLHLITDGRDTGPRTALEEVKKLGVAMDRFAPCVVGSIGGRFYAMDRDKRWDRVKKGYDAIVSAGEHTTLSAEAWVEKSYREDVTDEFISPVVITPRPPEPGDAVVFWNFREDRMREIVAALCLKDFKEVPRELPPFGADHVLCFTDYDHNYHLPYLFPQLEIKNHLGEVISAAKLTQLRVAETEKYPHVTYFFNGGIETSYEGEERALIPSPRDVKTYDEKPEMSAEKVTQTVVDAIASGKYDFIVVNLANCDMVGHTGVLEAAVRAVETVDVCLGKIVGALEAHGGTGVFLADHGNAEQMVNYADGTPHTAHTTFPVPFFISGGPKGITLRDGGALCDVAPTMLKLLGLPIPPEMTGKPLY